MSENKPNFHRLLAETPLIYAKESGTRNRKTVLEVVASENIEMEKSREKGQELQQRAKKLLELYQADGNLDPKKMLNDDTVEYFIARLDPATPEYTYAHLVELDKLAARAEFDPRLLPMAERAIETWEQLHVQRPVDFVIDGLRVDNHAVIELKKIITNFKSSKLMPGFAATAEKVLAVLREKHPVVMEVIEKMKELDSDE